MKRSLRGKQSWDFYFSKATIYHSGFNESVGYIACYEATMSFRRKPQLSLEQSKYV